MKATTPKRRALGGSGHSPRDGDMLSDLLCLDLDDDDCVRSFCATHACEASNGDTEITSQRLRCAKSVLALIADAVVSPRGDLWAKLEQASKTMLRDRAGMMQRRAKVVDSVQGAISSIQLERLPLLTRCSRCLGQVSSATCEYCGADVEHVNPNIVMPDVRRRATIDLMNSLVMCEHEFERLSDDAVYDLLYRGWSAPLVAAELTFMVGAFGAAPPSDPERLGDAVRKLTKLFDESWRVEQKRLGSYIPGARPGRRAARARPK